VTDTTLVFANPAHDYPQQITYTRSGTDSLVARIEGDRAGRRGPRTYSFRRADCPEVALPPATHARLALEPKYREAEQLEASTFAGHMDWFADNAGPDYGQVRWASPGSQVRVRGDSAMRQVAKMLRDANAAYRPRDLRLVVTLERVLVRGDTAEALVSALRTWRIVDDSARFGPAGAEHQRAESLRWIDRWVQEGGEWRLRRTDLFFEEVMFDGRVTVRNGQPVPEGSR